MHYRRVYKAGRWDSSESYSSASKVRLKFNEKNPLVINSNKIIKNKRYIIFCETALIDLLATLKKHLLEPERNQVKSTGDEYYECTAKNDGKNKSQRCQECLACSYFNFMTVNLQKNNDALIQCMHTLKY